MSIVNESKFELNGAALKYAIRRLKNESHDPSGKGRVIEIEGLDGVGKTTTSRSLADAMKVVALSTPINDIARRARKNIDEVAYRDPSSRFRFFSGSNVVDSVEHIRPLLEQGKDVVLDRFSISTIVGNAVLGADINGDPDVIRDADVETPNVVIPDITLWLKLDETERRRRLDGRQSAGAVTNNERDCDVVLQGKVSRLLDQLTEFGLVPVDITGLTVVQVREKVVDVLAQKGILLTPIK